MYFLASTGELCVFPVAFLHRRFQRHFQRCMSRDRVGDVVNDQHGAGDGVLVIVSRRAGHTFMPSAMLAIDPGLLPTHYGLGELLIEQGRIDAAIEQFSEVLRLQPDYEPALLQLGLAHT